MHKMVLSSLITLLGLQSIRVFTTGLVWVVGETSDRTMMGALALGAFSSAILAWPIIRWLGWHTTTVASASILALARLADQAIATPTVDVFLGCAGTLAFAWLAVSFLSTQGRLSGSGLATGMALDVAARAAFLTVDIPFSSSPVALLITFITSLGIVLLAWTQKRHGGPDQAPSAFRWTVAGIPSGLAMFMLVSGNFGQVSATGGLDWLPTVLWVSSGAMLGVAWALLPAAGHWRTMSLFGAIGLLITSLILFHGLSFGWAAAPFGAALARLLAWMPSAPNLGGRPNNTTPALTQAVATTLGFVIFVILIFAFYSFYAPAWVLIVSTLVVGLAGTFGAFGVVDLSPIHRRTTAVIVMTLILITTSAVLAPVIGRKEVTEGPQALDQDTVRIVSYNIRQGFGLSNRWNLEAVASEIERHKPDIVALQEVSRGWIISGMSDQLLWLGQRLGMDVQFGSNVGELWGNAVLTNFVARSENHRFNNHTSVPRGVLETLILFEGSGLRLMVTHLDHEDNAAQGRFNQIDELLDIWDGDPLTLVLGDINAEPDSAEYGRLTGAGLRDLLSEAGSPAPTSPANKPVARIDYAFASAGLELIKADTPKSLASDHLPIFIELQIP